MEIKTTDICDEHPAGVRVAASGIFKDFGGKKSFSGKIHTVKCFDNNPFVRNALEQNGEGKVLVVDGGGSMNCALLGDMLGEIAIKNKWNGIIINGCIRDAKELSELPIGVKAICTNPLKSGKNEQGEDSVKVIFAGIEFVPDEYVYCDVDGIIVSIKNLTSK